MIEHMSLVIVSAHGRSVNSAIQMTILLLLSLLLLLLLLWINRQSVAVVKRYEHMTQLTNTESAIFCPAVDLNSTRIF